MKNIISSFLFFLCVSSAISQSIVVEGFVVDNQNNRKLDNVEITVTDSQNNDPFVLTTDNNGAYHLDAEVGSLYYLSLERVAYENEQMTISVDSDVEDTINENISMQRLPGYEFIVDVKELLSGGNGKAKKLGQELKNLKVEIYNNTLGKEIRVTEDDPRSTLEANFERGNHYTMLIRKKGFYAKRIEVNVDIFGCVLCFEGLGSDFAPEIEAATDGNDRGLLIADIPMKRILKDETIRLDNIYYDYDKWNIRPDARPALNKLVQTLRSNPIMIELGSHTDSRGTDDYNISLSDKRARAAVDYILSRGIKATRITAKGYGETVPLNECIDEVKCSEKEYQFNRRTEFKVTGFLESTNFDKKSLKQILAEEKASKKRIKEKIEGM